MTTKRIDTENTTTPYQCMYCEARFATDNELITHFDTCINLPCGCESTEHFEDHYGPQTAHNYLEVTAGQQRALWVGRICDTCATTHMNGYLLGCTGEPK